MKLLWALSPLGIVATIQITWTGWVLSVLWGWFIVPQFGLPPLSLPVAMGLMLVVYTCGSDKDVGATLEMLSQMIATAMWRPTFALVLGWILVSCFHIGPAARPTSPAPSGPAPASAVVTASGVSGRGSAD